MYHGNAAGAATIRQRKMHRALRPGGDVLALEHLFNAGAPVDSVDEEGRTALYVAAGSGYLDAVRWLLGQGADPLIVAFDSRSPLHAAAASGHASVCDQLLEALDRTSALRAMQAPDATGRNPAEVAAASSHVDVVRVLLSAHTRFSRDVQHGQEVGVVDAPEASNKQRTEVTKLASIRGFAPMVQSPLRTSGGNVNVDKTP